MTLFFYILKDFLKYVTGTIILSTFLFVLFDFIHKTTKYFSIYNPSVNDMLRFYGFQLPSLLSQALPIAALLGSVICMVLLSRTNEITAMRAAGMGPAKIGLPIAIGGLLITGLAIFLGELVIPKTSAKMHYIQQVVIEGKEGKKTLEQTKWLRSNQRLFNYDEFNPLTRTMTQFKLIEVGANFRPLNILEAERALYDPYLDAWELQDITNTKFFPNGTIRETAKLSTQMIGIPIAIGNLKQERRSARELSLFELDKIISDGRAAGTDITSFEVDFHVKMAFHFAAFVVSLIGIRFAYQSERKVESAKSILIAFGIGMSYWFILSSLRAYAMQGTIPAVLGAWAANFVIIAVASLQIWRAQPN